MAIVDEAQKHGLKPVGHVPETVYLEDAAKAGQKSCEHMFGFGKVIAKLLGEPVVLESGGMGTDVEYFSRRTEVDSQELRNVLHRVRDFGMVVCPTLVVMKHGAHLKEIMSGNYPNLEYASSMIRDIWKSMWNPQQQNTDLIGKVWPHMQAFVAELHKARIPLIAGTDLLFPGIIPGFSLHEEMLLWQEAGIPPADVLRSATLGPAKFVGLDNRLGSVTEGKTASLVLLRANPLEDIRNAGRIESVFLRGLYFSRTDLDRLLREAVELS
jgi:imidazolonepropionase-like amidohydrolase